MYNGIYIQKNYLVFLSLTMDYKSLDKSIKLCLIQAIKLINYKKQNNKKIIIENKIEFLKIKIIFDKFV